MSTGMFPEKMAMYFSTMSPLATKIYTDIQAVEAKTGPNLTYNDRCSMIDKHLIYDLVHNVGSHNKQSHYNRSELSLNSLDKEVHTVFHDDPVLDQDHVSALLLSVYPKKPEKYIYDDNSFWIDEHSVPYSCCTTSQANICKLAEFVRALPVPQSQEIPSTRLSKKYKAPMKPPAAPVQNPVDEYHSDYDEDSDGEEFREFEEKVQPIVEEEKKPVPIKKTGGIIGVSVMGGFGGPPPKPPSGSSDSTQTEKEAQLEDNLPQQKQNSDLIAELQAKLKMNKSSKLTSQHSPQVASGSKSQISKPKAPPPPPPKVPGSAVKVEAKEQKVKHRVLTERKESTTSNSSDEGRKSGKENSEDDFIVDISSPCRIATPKTGFDFLDNW